MNQAIAHLQQDPVLSRLIATIPPFVHRRTGDIFPDLVDSIVSQQLSMKAAATIFGRFKALFPNEEITPEALVTFSHEQFRAVGLSNAKARYVRDLAEKVLSGVVNLKKLLVMSDEDIISHLVQVKGIGRWTAEMVLMFTLDRPDVLPVDDLGIQKAFCKMFGRTRGSAPTDLFKKRMVKTAEKWKPYRTLACRYLWKSLEIR